LKESGLVKGVFITAKKGEIPITAARRNKKISETIIISEKVLARDWLRPEEDRAWASLK